MKVGMYGTERQIVTGISLDAEGQASVDASLNNVLFDLALKLEEITNLPVDVQHVVAAIVLAEREGDVSATNAISASNRILVSALATHVKSVFALYGGKVGKDD